jgi:bestrophin, other
MTRVNTVASALKRFLSRDGESRPESATPDYSLPTLNPNRMAGSASSASIAPRFPPQGSMKITDQVIEEVDEQMTITSMANQHPDNRPTAESIFQHGPVTRSAPMDVPVSSLGGTPGYYRTHSAVAHGDSHSLLFPAGGVDDLLSASAPVGESMMAKAQSSMPPMDNMDRNKSASRDTETHSITSEELDGKSHQEPDDDFEKLRQVREKEREERHKQKLARSVSNQPAMMTGGGGGGTLDTELLMEQLSAAEADLEDKESRRYSTDPSDTNL